MLKLEWIGQSTVPLEAECIRPDVLAGMSTAAIERLEVQHGNRTALLAEFFRVSGDPGDARIQLEGDLSRVKWIGAGMTGGSIRVDGNVGMHLGSEMAGGEIRVAGNAGDWVGAEMRGGLICVQGSTGHQPGAAYRGSRRGMCGGTILIHGSAGNEIGGTMRRGLVAVAGAAGDFAGVSMIAGTILLFGSVGIRGGAGMKRGTLGLLGPVAESALLPTFRFDCDYHAVFLSLYLNRLRRLGFPVPDAVPDSLVRRYSGDLVSLGKGEILLRTRQ